MQTEILTGYKSASALAFVFNSMYKSVGWEIKSPIEKKWSWKHFSHVYEMEVKRTKPSLVLQYVENWSLKNNLQYSFYYTTDDGTTHKKVFWYSEDTDLGKEFEEWVETLINKTNEN
jgi:hypothetical protein